MEQVNWGIVGPGGIATEFASAIKEVNGRIFGVWGRSADKTNRFAEQFDIENIYADTQSMFQDPRIDIIYIATPHSVHYSFIMDALQAGKHVLCEKAITVNAVQLQEIMDLAMRKNLIVAEAMTIYHMPLYQRLKTLIEQGVIGKVNMANVTFGSSKEDDPTNRFFNPDLAGGAILDIGTYALSFVRFFLSSQPTELHTTVKKYRTGVDEQSGIVMKNDQEELAVVSLAMRAKMPKRGIIAGDKGVITVDDFPRADKATVTYTIDGTTETIEAGDTTKALHYEVEAMNGLILEEKDHWTLSYSRQVMDLMDEARRKWNLEYVCEGLE